MGKQSQEENLDHIRLLVGILAGQADRPLKTGANQLSITISENGQMAKTCHISATSAFSQLPSTSHPHFSKSAIHTPARSEPPRRIRPRNSCSVGLPIENPAFSARKPTDTQLKQYAMFWISSKC
jgi:hypothetical protein